MNGQRYDRFPAEPIDPPEPPPRVAISDGQLNSYAGFTASTRLQRRSVILNVRQR